MRRLIIGMTLLSLLTACGDSPTGANTKIEDVAGNKHVDSFMRAFEGLGALTDSSVSTPPQQALAAFKYPNDLALDLVLAEPSITQPLHLSFDHRGRMWVVQYNQYPYPKGLKVIDIDQYLRAKYNDLPKAPPDGEKGADKITVFEDTDGDGTYDKSTVAITGLNMATSMVLGRGKIWVLNPPYLLAYPDANRDGIPDGAPEVHLRGFGLEDTHAVANSLRWGPDGWLYGAQGSTCTADISSAVTKHVKFNGQAIWRYHPGTKVFEIFAEGGGNTFYVEIDDKGRFYSGHNGNERGMYYKQGAYYVKNVDKHGAVTNAYAFGHLPSMVLKGEKLRFTHAFIKYEGAALPEHYKEKMIAINPLQNFVQLSTFDVNGSTFSNTDQERILKTTDRWFRPVDIKTGPDGAVYLADWYDSRLSHVDPRDTWDKGSGRIYRMRGKDQKAGVPAFDISKYSTSQLVQLLSHPNKWFRQQALQEFGDRKDKTTISKLTEMLSHASPQTALEALWAIHLSGGFTDAVAITALQHSDPFVRSWAIRLTGDTKQVSPQILTELVALAAKEPHPEVRSQLAATCKRLPAGAAMPIIKNLLIHHNDTQDPDIPLQLWWAIESKAVSDRQAVLSLFSDKAVWNSDIVIKDLMQRYIMAGGDENFNSAAQLIKLAPSVAHARMLVTGLNEALRGAQVSALPASIIQALAPYKKELGQQLLAISLRQGDAEAVNQALKMVADPRVKTEERRELIRIIGEINNASAVPAFLRIAEDKQSPALLREASLQALQRFDQPAIGARLVQGYNDRFRSDSALRQTVLNLLVGRTAWAQELLKAVEAGQINKKDIPVQTARQLMALNNASITATVKKFWPQASGASSTDKSNKINQVKQVLSTGQGDAVVGQGIFNKLCGSCHKLFDEGGTIGPDLTGYDRKNLTDLLINIIDPNAYIREGYVMSTIVTKDGRTLMGTIVSRSSKTISIRQLNGEQLVLANDQIKETKESNASVMPEKLLDNLSEKELRDLFSFISKQKK